MKQTIFLLVFGILFLNSNAEDNPLKVETYKLKNGLTVYLNVDNTMPMVNGMVAVKGGSKRDPKDATGIAHYFEHIMFKGTGKMGTIDYETEKVYLDSISDLYDALGETEVKDERLAIQKEINRISIKAAEYAIPNEIDKVLTRMGGTRINAFTSHEAIAYFNQFPANQIEKWLEVYCHRFENPVFRLFQSELETVYEEKNMYADDPFSNMFEAVFKEFYKTSPYGQQTIIGTADHLKNPSLSKMKTYFDTYYVANNMALILTGDFDPEKVKPLIEEKFGNWRAGDVPKDLEINEAPFKGREQVTKRMTPVKIGVLGYRTVPKNHKDELALELCTSLLSNYSSTGLIDKLSQDNKLMFAGALNYSFTEIGAGFVYYVPKIVGQSIGNAEKLVIEQINKLKTGDFPDELFEGVKTIMNKQAEQDLEDLRWRTYAIMDVFLYNSSWEEMLKKSEELGKLTKQDIINVANQYFGDDYLAFYSKMGFPKKDKIKKPDYKPIPALNSEKVSDYAKQIEEMPTVDMAPKFIDFGEDVKHKEIGNGISVFTANNPINEIFSLRFVIGKGSFNDPLVEQAVKVFEYASPKDMKLSDFKRKIQALGCEMYTESDLSSVTINISGLEKNLGETLELFDKLFTNLSIDEDHVEKLSQDFEMNLKFEKKDVNKKSEALENYALYGEDSGYLKRFGKKDLKNVEVSQLIDKLKEIFTYAYELHYCGNLTTDEFIDVYKTKFNIPEGLKKGPGKIEKQRIAVKENTIYLMHDAKAVQSHINILVEGGVNSEESRIKMAGFNDYIDGNMSSIIFQEIREFRSLAYGSYGWYHSSFFKDKPGYFGGWLSTQADKTVDAIEVYSNILDSLPQKPERIEDVRKNLTVSINAKQPTFRRKTNTVSRWMAQGYTMDPRELRYADYQKLSFDDINSFYKNNLSGKPKVITIVGNTKEIDRNELAKYGKIVDVKWGDIFKE